MTTRRAVSASRSRSVVLVNLERRRRAASCGRLLTGLDRAGAASAPRPDARLGLLSCLGRAE